MFSVFTVAHVVLGMQYDRPLMSVNSVYQPGKRNLVSFILVIECYDFHFMLSYSLLVTIK